MPIIFKSHFCYRSMSSVVHRSHPLSEVVKPSKTKIKSAPSLIKFEDIIHANTQRQEEHNHHEAKKFLHLCAKELHNDAFPSQIDWSKAMTAICESEKHFPSVPKSPDELDKIKDLTITHNLAKVADNSLAIKKLIDLGVDLAHWEKKHWTGFALTLDFMRDIRPRLVFLADLGLTPDQMRDVLTEGAEFLQQDMDHLHIRVDYLRSKAFSKEAIVNVISNNPSWLTFSVEEIDSRLGYFQKTFSLRGKEVRGLASLLPRLITWPGVPSQIRYNDFTLKEVCGFSPSDCKALLLKEPKIYMAPDEKKLEATFSLLHNDVGYPHQLLLKYPSTLLASALDIQPRLDFLKKLNRAQIDPKKPNYVSPAKFANLTDLEFCEQVAKCSIELYNDYLKAQ